MTATLDLLNRYKDLHSLASDYAAAKQLGIRHQTISNWRQGGTMDETTALQIAQDIGADELAVLAAVRLERPATPRERRVWERYCARVLVAALVAVAFTATDRHALATVESSPALNDTTTYTLCALAIMRAVQRALRALRGGPPRPPELRPTAAQSSA